MVNNSTSRLDAVFSALSDPTRRNILERLARGPLTVGELGAGFSISQPGISKHVRVLEESGLLKRVIVGRMHRCTLSAEGMQAASEWMERQQRFWNAALDWLGALVEPSQRKRKK